MALELVFTQSDVEEMLSGLALRRGAAAGAIAAADAARLAERINGRIRRRLARLVATEGLDTVAAGEVVPVRAILESAGA